MAEELYSKEGKPFGFQDVLRLANYVSSGSASKFMKEVMPVAQDRFFRFPIYELPNAIIGTSLSPPYRGAYYPDSRGVILNPSHLDRSRPEETRAFNTLDHEAYHHAANVDRGLVDRANDLVEKSAKAKSARDSVNYYLMKGGHYMAADVPEEVQAWTFSNTMPKTYAAPTLGFLTPSEKYKGDAASKVMQDAIYPALQGVAKKRFSRMAPKQETPASGYVKNALDSFMSIIGLGAK